MSALAGPSGTSSDDDIQMVDGSGNAIASTSAAGADGPESDAEDVGEDEYEIEYIVSHSQETTDGQLSYFVKWKGYPDSENSWVYESDMGGAQEMITEYWAKVPKAPVKKMGTKGGKKAGRRQSSLGATGGASAGKKRTRRESSLANGDAATPSQSNRKRGALGELQPSRSPTPDDDSLISLSDDPAILRIRSDPTLSEEEKQKLESQHIRALKLDRLRKRYARIADWDPIVKRIEAVEKMSDNKLRVFVNFENGDKMAFENVVVHHRAPLKLLAFYEANLRFKQRESEEERPLEGEEPDKELDQWNKQRQEEAEKENQGEGEGEAEGEAQARGTGGEAPAPEAEAPPTAAAQEEQETQQVAVETAEEEQAETAPEEPSSSL